MNLLSAVIGSWHRFHVSLAVWATWLGILIVLEVLAVFWKGCPWETLSSTAWDAESVWRPAFVLFAAFLIALSVHILARVSAGLLITVVVGAAVALVAHLIVTRVFHAHPAWLGMRAPVKDYVKAAVAR